MNTNTRFTVMVHILTLLATEDRPLSSSWIAGSVNTNPVVIRQAMAPLKSAGLVETIPGSSGGTRLAQPADRIRLSHVYALVKPDTLFGLHHNAPNPNCLVGHNIQTVLTGVFDQLDAMIEETLGAITIADMLAQVQERDATRRKDSYDRKKP